MTEIQFYHLTKTPLDYALPKILEKALQGGFRVVVRLDSSEKLEAMNALLWTYDPDSFLPHGTAEDGNSDKQPIYLTCAEENPNQADLLIIADGSLAPASATYRRVLDMFDGSDDAMVTAARERWKNYQAAGHSLTYLKQTPQGGWEKQ